MKKQYDYAGAVSRLKQEHDLIPQKIAGTIVYDNDKISVGRMKYDSRYNAIFLYAKNRRSYGSIIYDETDEGIKVSSITLNEPIQQAETDWFQKFEIRVLKICKYIIKNTHPNLWQDLKADALSVEKNLPKLKEWFYAVSCRQVMDTWGLYTDESEKEISAILNVKDNFFLYPHKVKTLSVRSCGFAESVISELKTAIENKREYYATHRGNYDYSIRVEPHSNDLVKAFLSAEFKDCANGHYYLLLNENNSIHYEDD